LERLPFRLRWTPAFARAYHSNCDDANCDGMRRHAGATGGKVNPAFLDSLRLLLGEGLITSREELRTYECDGLTNLRVVPVAVALPSTAEQVQAIVRLCAREHVAFVARGSGTGLSGGALPVEGGIVISGDRAPAGRPQGAARHSLGRSGCGLGQSRLPAANRRRTAQSGPSIARAAHR
jgi:hypothetical protein